MSLSVSSGFRYASSQSVVAVSTQTAAQGEITIASVAHPVVIAHRGASGCRPEHTLEAYRLAFEQGADFIEPDLVPTRDGYLIARHENQLSGSTNVAEHPEFAFLHTTKCIDGHAVTGWFSEDFTLAEIKTLRAKERIPETRPHNKAFDGLFEIPTLEEIIELVKHEQRRTSRKLGLYPETKNPTYFAAEGVFLDGTQIKVSLGQQLIDTLVAEGFTDPERVFIQSFEFANLIELRDRIMPAANVSIPLVQLYGDIANSFGSFSRPYDMVFNAARGADLRSVYGELVDLVAGGITETTHYGDLISEPVLQFIARRYASAVGPWKNSLLPRRMCNEPSGAGDTGQFRIRTQLTGEVHPFLARALGAKLQVHPYTLRAEEEFLTLDASAARQSILAEVVQLLALGVHGFFIDQPLEGVKGRDLYRQLNRPPEDCRATDNPSPNTSPGHGLR